MPEHLFSTWAGADNFDRAYAKQDSSMKYIMLAVILDIYLTEFLFFNNTCDIPHIDPWMPR